MTDSATNLDKRRPGWVALASILLFAGAALGGISALYTHGMNFIGVALFLFNVGLLVVAGGVMLLKKWAYWAYIGLAAFVAMSVAADMLLVTLDMAPPETVTVLKLVRGVISIVWMVYFFTEPVRRAFDIALAVARQGTQTDGPASGGPAA